MRIRSRGSDAILFSNRTQAFLWSTFLLSLLVVSALTCHTQQTDLELADTWVSEKMSSMTLREKVGQMFIVALDESTSPFDADAFESARFWVESFHAGGFLLFKETPLEQASLVRDLQKLAAIPLLITQDMEWGASMRVDHATTFPRAMSVAATASPQAAYDVGRITGEEARVLGVNMILAPVADVISNPKSSVIAVRSFGDDPVSVSTFVNAFIRGVSGTDLLSTAKHFPGHGATSVDSHRALPVVDAARISSDSLDLLPFRGAIATGVPAIMTGHIAFPDSSDTALVPATFSRRLIGDILRSRLGFDGLVVSDALNMKSIPKEWTSGEVAVRAISAGVDLLLMSPDPVGARNAVLRAIRDNRISQERIDESVERILRQKYEFVISGNVQGDLNDVRETLMRPEHRATAARIAREGLVALENESVLPILPSSSVVLVSLIETGSESKADELERVFRQNHGGRVSSFTISTRNWRSRLEAILRESRKFSTIVFADLASEYTPRPGTVSSILKRLRSLHIPIVLSEMASPYSIKGLSPPPEGLLISFGSPDVSIRAVAEALTGRSRICGKLPIGISAQYARGFGLCLAQSFPRSGYPAETGLSDVDFRKLNERIRDAIADSAFPAAAIAVGRGGVVADLKGFGRFEYDSGASVTSTSLFDLASLTKTIATTTAIMQLYEAGKIELDDPVSQYLPLFKNNGKENITIRDLLTHTGGLIPFRRFYQDKSANRASVIRDIFSDTLAYAPGTRYRYSDFGPIVLAFLVEKLTGVPFDRYARKFIFEPLGMRNTSFRRATLKRDQRVVPTEQDDYFRHTLVQGSVHDETAWLLGGTAGHAGLFSTAEDLARFAFMYISNGQIGDRVFLKPETIRLFTTPVDPYRESTRALGWDTKSMTGYSSAGTHFGPRSFGHTGFTGTSFWIDPDQSLYVILLTNRVYPTRENRKHVRVRPEVADRVFEAIRTGLDDPFVLEPE